MQYGVEYATEAFGYPILVPFGFLKDGRISVAGRSVFEPYYLQKVNCHEYKDVVLSNQSLFSDGCNAVICSGHRRLCGL